MNGETIKLQEKNVLKSGKIIYATSDFFLNIIFITKNKYVYFFFTCFKFLFLTITKNVLDKYNTIFILNLIT